MQHAQVRAAVRKLVERHDDLLISTQNIAEFCNVATWPIDINGFGISPSAAIALFERDVESIVGVLVETDQLHAQLSALL